MSINPANLARLGAHTLHSKYGPEVSEPGRKKAAANLDARLLQEIDEHAPGLPEAERLRRLGHARKAHFTRLAFQSAQARKRQQRRGK